jgi:putative salt-induced outer membrane protein
VALVAATLSISSGKFLMKQVNTLLKCVAASVALSGAATYAEAIPASVAAMIKQSGANPAVVDSAKATNPASAAEIDALVTSMAAEVAAAKEAKMRDAGFTDNWKGQGEAGIGLTSGNSSEFSAFAAIALVKDDFKFRHKINLAADYQRSGTPKVTTKERYSASYGLDYKFNDRLYAWSLLGYERDPFAGYKSRFTEGAGIGYRVTANENSTWDVEVGPTLRQTKFIDGTSKNQLTGRVASIYFMKINNSLSFDAKTAILFGSGNTSVLSNVGLAAKLSDNFSARLSYDTQFESKPPIGKKQTDSAIRATIVYDIGK